VPIIRRNNRIYATLGTCYSVWMTGMQGRPKHVESRNKHTKKNCAPSWLYLQDLLGYESIYGLINLKTQAVCVQKRQEAIT